MKKSNIYTAAIGVCAVFSFVLVAMPFGNMSQAQTTFLPVARIFQTNLTIGSQGFEVTTLQNILAGAGYLQMPPGVQKGYFGALTKAAVIKYQIANNISPAAGFVGPITRARLNTVFDPPPTDTKCTAITSSIFRSVLPAGGTLIPGVTLLDHWGITFKNDGTLALSQHNYTGTGTYSCRDGVIQAKISPNNRLVVATYDSTTKILNFDGVNYNLLPTTPTITVTSPKAGDQILSGSTHTIKWEKAEIPNSYIMIWVHEGRPCNTTIHVCPAYTFQRDIASKISDTGSYEWNVDLQKGEYVIAVTRYLESGDAIQVIASGVSGIFTVFVPTGNI